MADWTTRLKGLLGGKAPAKKKPQAKITKTPQDRAALLAEAMAIYHRERANAEGVLEEALKELKAKPPKPSDVAGMTRLLTLRQTLLTMKANRAGETKRPKPKSDTKPTRR
jgi:hypothetical protein